MERRQHQRFKRPLDGIWRDPSGSSLCRISDISVGGCFIESLALPRAGERAQISVTIGGQTMAFEGEVLYNVTNIGFAVKFQPLTAGEREALEAALGALQSR